MKRALLVFGIAVGLSSLGGFFGSAALAALTTLDLNATGAEENPPVTNSPGRAHAQLVFDSETRVMTFAVLVVGLTPEEVTAAHIHRGARGVNGPVIHPISDKGFARVEGKVTLSEADVADLRAGNLYLNVHSRQHPGGFARAQLIMPGTQTAAPAAAASAPAAPTPALPRAGEGSLLADESGLSGVEIAALIIAGMGAGGLLLWRRRWV